MRCSINGTRQLRGGGVTLSVVRFLRINFVTIVNQAGGGVSLSILYNNETLVYLQEACACLATHPWTTGNKTGMITTNRIEII